MNIRKAAIINTEPNHGTRSIPELRRTTGVDSKQMQLFEQVMASRTFSKSPRLKKFLEFICTSLFEGRAGDINEQQIGIQVFGRSESYNAADDSIVRTQARLLRQRLEEYFEHESPESSLILLVPKGGYVPVFEPRRELAAQPASVTTQPLKVEKEPDSSISSSRSSHFRWGWVAAIGILLLVIGIAGSHILNPSPLKTFSSAFWTRTFPPGKTVLIVPSDDALVLFQEFTRKPVALNEYLNGTYLTNADFPQGADIRLNADWFASHQYTSSADLKLSLRLGRLPEARNANIETHEAHALRTDDLKRGNVILIGGVGANPWVQLFADRLNFDVSWDWRTAEGFVRNKKPAPGESAIYRDTLAQDGTRRSYGVLAFLPGIDGNGVALLFEGTGMAGTESASDFPFSTERFEKFAKAIGATPDHIPFFEVLLETSSIGGNAPEARVVAYRILD